MCHTVLLPLSQPQFFISHSFRNFEWIFSQTKKITRATQSPVKKYRSMVSTYKKIVILDLDNPRITKDSVENTHQASIWLKLFFSWIAFVIIWNFLELLSKLPMLEGLYERRTLFK